MPTALVTGAAGFIGFHVSKALVADGYDVVGIDNMSDYYDVSLKEARLAQLENCPFHLIKANIEAPDILLNAFEANRPDVVIHLAAQAGVRHSIDAPRDYLNANLCGTFELLEAARAYKPKHMLMASTSSAYGANTQMTYRENMQTDHQMSFYAATKKSNEMMAHSYSHLYSIPITLFRFFTVYGPWGRPDMALFKFTKAILEGNSIDVYNYGNMKRDFTYIDDLVASISALISKIPGNVPKENDSLSPVAPWRVINIGNGTPIELSDYISALEEALGATANKNMLGMQPGDVPATWADTTLLEELTGSVSTTGVKSGVAHFVDWYLKYYNAARPR